MYSNVLRKCTSRTLVDKTMKIIWKYWTLVNWSLYYPVILTSAQPLSSPKFHSLPSPTTTSFRLSNLLFYRLWSGPQTQSSLFGKVPFFLSLSLFLPLTGSYSSLKGLWDVIFRAVFPAVPTGISPSACLLHVPMSVFPKSLRVFMGTGTLRQLSGESNSHIAELNIYKSELKGKNNIPSEKQNLYQKLF